MFESPGVSYIKAVTVELPAHRSGSVFPYFSSIHVIPGELGVVLRRVQSQPKSFSSFFNSVSKGKQFACVLLSQSLTGRKQDLGEDMSMRKYPMGDISHVTSQRWKVCRNWTVWILLLTCESACCLLSCCVFFLLLFLRLSLLLLTVWLLLITSMKVNDNAN